MSSAEPIMTTSMTENKEVSVITFSPTFRRYNPELDYEPVIALFQAEGFEPPSIELVFAVVATINDDIVGFISLLKNDFVEPLVVKSSLPLVTKVKIIDSMLYMIGGVALYLDIKRLYFSPEIGKEKFVAFLQRQFKVKEFIEKKVYVVEL